MRLRSHELLQHRDVRFASLRNVRMYDRRPQLELQLKVPSVHSYVERKGRGKGDVPVTAYPPATSLWGGSRARHTRQGCSRNGGAPLRCSAGSRGRRGRARPARRRGRRPTRGRASRHKFISTSHRDRGRRAYLDRQTIREQRKEPREADCGEVDTQIREVRMQFGRVLFHVVEQY
jgi:hypothetical protein